MNLQFFEPETSKSNRPVWVGNVRPGMVVQATTFPDGYPDDRELDDMFGHIVGFARNTSNELILEVRWERGFTGPIHPSQVSLLIPTC